MSTVAHLLPNTIAGKVAAGIGLCFLGYCVYFDYRRRNHPDFKKKLREKRRLAKSKSKTSSQLPDPENPEAVQAFMFQEIQTGEECINSGDIEGGLEHLSNAVVVCGQPQRLLMVFQQTLPPQVFQLLIQKITTMQAPSSGSNGVVISEIKEEGVE